MIFTPDFSVFIYKTEHVHWKRPLNQQIPRGGCFGGRPAQWHSPLGQVTQVHGSARGRGRPGKAAVGAGQAGQGAASAISLGPRHRAHFSAGTLGKRGQVTSFPHALLISTCAGLCLTV